MKTDRLIDWQYVIGLCLMPVFVLLLFFLAAWIQGKTIFYEPYFSPEYQARYSTPDDLIVELEQALQIGDSAKIAELQGTRSAPKNLTPRPEMGFSIHVADQGPFKNYLFMDRADFHRLMAHLKWVNGRYVLVPENLIYYLESGEWTNTFFPVATIWWLVLGLFTVGMLFFRYMRKIRQEMFSDRPPR